ncbi:MAG: YaiO family outer membrane beta-barrel protein [Gemmatimonadales bacterium]|nr:MAG: YaiO family outer membrane beta-barrel protein [Gemmatimonadales bacterium]
MRTIASVAVLTAVFLAASPVSGTAQEAVGPAGWFQAEGFYHHVTNDFGDWKGGALRLHAPMGTSTIWNVDALGEEAFGDRGAYVSLGNRHQFGPSWFTYLSVGSGTGDFLFPDFRADFTLGKAWLPRRNIVTMAGMTYVNAKEGFEDVAFDGSLAVYLPGIVFQGGGRVNWSYPEAVRSGRGYGAITIGRERARTLTLRGSGGWEGYQLTGVDSTRRRFRSQEGSAAWREWLGGGGAVGFFLQAEWYHNTFYDRKGLTLGIFHHW